MPKTISKSKAKSSSPAPTTAAAAASFMMGAAGLPAGLDPDNARRANPNPSGTGVPPVRWNSETHGQDARATTGAPGSGSDQQDLVRAKVLISAITFRAGKSGGKHAALQTLREVSGVRQSRQRLDCGGFSTAFMQVKAFFLSIPSHPGESAVAAPVCAALRRGKALCRRSPKCLAPSATPNSAHA